MSPFSLRGIPGFSEASAAPPLRNTTTTPTLDQLQPAGVHDPQSYPNQGQLNMVAPSFLLSRSYAYVNNDISHITKALLLARTVFNRVHLYMCSYSRLYSVLCSTVVRAG